MSEEIYPISVCTMAMEESNRWLNRQWPTHSLPLKEPQRAVLDPHAILLLLGLSILGAALLPQVMSGWQFWHVFGPAQVAYALPTGVALFVSGFYASRGVSTLLSPTVSIMVGFLLFFSAGPLINPPNAPWSIELYSHPEYYLPVVGLYLLGVCAFMLGVYWAPMPTFSAAQRRWLAFPVNRNRLWLGFLVVLGIVIGCYGALIILNQLDPFEILFASRYGRTRLGLSHPLSRYFDQLLRYFVITTSGLAGAVFALSPQLLRRGVALLAIGICTLYILSSGVRSHFLYSLGGAALVWWHLDQAQRQGQRSRGTWRLWLIGGLAILLAIQMIRIRNASGGLLAYLSSDAGLIGVQQLVDYGVDRNIALQQAVEAVPERRPYIWGQSFVSPFVAFVPRVLWPNKPTTTWGYMVGHTIFTNPNTSFSILGELHINFGLPGIALGMMIAGILTQRWRQLYLRYSNTIPMTIFYAMSLPAFAFFVRGDFQAALNSAFYPIILVFVVLNLSRS